MITATISTYNREKYLPKVLASLARQTLSRDLFEVILVDNNSPGNTPEIFNRFQKDHPKIKSYYYLETNQGLSFGRNRGIKEANGKYITFIDDDAYLADDYLEVIYNYFEDNPKVASIGSKIHLHYEETVPKWENKYLNSLLGYFDIGNNVRFFPKNDYPRGSNMSFKMSVFEVVGHFNTELGRVGNNLAGSEEKDIYKRIYQHPDLLVAYIPNAMVYHYVPHQRTTESFIKKQAIGTGNSEKNRVKNEGQWSTIKRYLIELFKWGASITLFLFYLIKAKPAKGKMILKFRYWVSKGLLE